VREWPTIDVPEGTLAVGDLHLDVFESDAPRRFRAWCESLQAPHLLILGDLFEFWVGRHQVDLPGSREVTRGLRDLSDRDVGVDVLWGNRDFLLGRPFEQASGARVFPRGVRCRPAGESGEAAPGTLFIHGDELCSADRTYQRMRAVLRFAPLRALQSSLPLALQLRMAGALRTSSARSTAAKAMQEVRMVTETAAALGEASQCQTLVCGHAHQWRDESLGALRWIVLDAWGGPRDAVHLCDGRWEGVSSGCEQGAAGLR